MRQRVDIQSVLAQTFGRLTPISEVEQSADQSRQVRCRCQCGNVLIVRLTNLKRGGAKSCGCSRGTHHRSKTKEYRIWSALIARCTVPGSVNWLRYGAQGITVCDRWKNSFVAFWEDMGPKPDGMSLERINNRLGYSPENCKWATLHEQSRNTSRNHLVTFHGVTKCLKDWASEFGVNYSTVGYRVRSGAPIGKWFDPPNLHYSRSKRKGSE
jgi:hypothetical protein